MDNAVQELLPIANWLREIDDSHLTDNGMLTVEGGKKLESDFLSETEALNAEQAQAMMDSRADNVTRWLINLDRSIKGCAEEIKYLQTRKKMMQGTFESVKESTRRAMFSRGIKKAGSTHTLQRVNTAGRLEVTDASAVPNRFKRIELKIDMAAMNQQELQLIFDLGKIAGCELDEIVSKTSVRAAMKTEQINGAEIVPGEALRFRQSTRAPDARE